MFYGQSCFSSSHSLVSSFLLQTINSTQVHVGVDASACDKKENARCKSALALTLKLLSLWHFKQTSWSTYEYELDALWTRLCWESSWNNAWSWGLVHTYLDDRSEQYSHIRRRKRRRRKEEEDRFEEKERLEEKLQGREEKMKEDKSNGAYLIWSTVLQWEKST